jgi:8-oxo-dGTP pyrophosphatase MutT (NUDIX family)
MTVSRDFTVAVFVVRGDRVLLHLHRRLERWLPPGGHIEPNELPDSAAVREVLEETGVAVELVGPSENMATGLGQPVQLTRPIGVQLAEIGPDGHQHIDLVYLARGLDDGNDEATWFSAEELDDLELTDEVRQWCRIALRKLPGR